MDAFLPQSWPPQVRDAVVGVGLSAGAIVALPAVLGAVGFGSAGIVASSTAASWMAASAPVAGGVYATLQAAGMTGLSVAGSVGLSGIVTVANVVGGAFVPGRSGGGAFNSSTGGGGGSA